MNYFCPFDHMVCSSLGSRCHIQPTWHAHSLQAASETNQLTKMAAAADFVAFVITFSISASAKGLASSFILKARQKASSCLHAGLTKLRPRCVLSHACSDYVRTASYKCLHNDINLLIKQKLLAILTRWLEKFAVLNIREASRGWGCCWWKLRCQHFSSCRMPQE